MSKDKAVDLFSRYLKQQREIGTSEIIISKSSKKSESGESDNSSLLPKLCEETQNCSNCGLSKTRKNYVFGSGNSNARLMFIGEAPGQDEDLQGKPFVGPAGQLLTKMIGAMGLSREEVYIGNILKCRPPQNRNPLPEEISMCINYLYSQIDIIKPKIICALGKFASQTLLGIETPISKIRGSWHEYRGIRFMPTYHPAYLLRNPGDKKLVWEDMKKIMNEMMQGTGMPVPYSLSI